MLPGKSMQGRRTGTGGTAGSWPRVLQEGRYTALDLLELRRKSLLENPLWGEGLGNPWRGVENDPLAYHWSRYVHLFSNQLGFDMVR